MTERPPPGAARTREETARAAFERAVSAEFDAIKCHEAAARHQEQIAAQLERHARTDPAGYLREEALAHAANARQRAEQARTRAVTARQRLEDEGVGPTDARPDVRATP